MTAGWFALAANRLALASVAASFVLGRACDPAYAVGETASATIKLADGKDAGTISFREATAGGRSFRATSTARIRFCEC